jgi:hypothetical protein
MRQVTIVLGLAAIVAALAIHPADAAKSKMGCEKGKEMWSAADGKCVPGVSKYSKMTAKKSAKKAPAKN